MAMRPVPERFEHLAVDFLRDLVRIDTSNPPGNELPAALYLQQQLQLAGIETTLLEPSPRRANLIARLPGTGKQAPFLLTGHLDVVPASGQDWQYPPFAAEIHNGMVWGRGTTDMKSMVSISAVILIALAQSGIKLGRDLILAATADEEQGSTYGMAWLINHARELLDAECALNEGGGNCIYLNDRPFVTFQTAEKGIYRSLWTAFGKDGHASQPTHEAAPIRLARALTALGDGYIQGGITATMRKALEKMTASAAPETQALVTHLFEQRRIEAALTKAGFDLQTLRAVRNLFYNTAAVSALQAGDPRTLNMLPAKAQAWVDGRMLPGYSCEQFLGQLQQRCGRDIVIEPIQRQYSAGQELPIDSELFRVTEQLVAQALPGAVLVPWMCAGATDASYLYQCGIPTYGFMPMLARRQEQLVPGPHAANERISLETVRLAVCVLYNIVCDYCGPG